MIVILSVTDVANNDTDKLCVLSGTSDNMMSRMANKRLKNGEPAMYVLQGPEENTCEECKMKNKVRCIHEIIRLPEWRTREDAEWVTAMMDDDDSAAREMGGNITGGSSMPHDQYVESVLSKSRPYRFKYDCEMCYLLCDPSAGGEGSDYVLMAVVYEEGKFVVAAMARYPGKDFRLINSLFGPLFLNRILSLSRFRNCKFAVIFERNLNGPMADEKLALFQENFPNHVYPQKMCDTDPTLFGCITTEHSKEAFTGVFNSLLQVGLIRFAENFVFFDPEKPNQYSGLETARPLIENQLRQWAKIPRDTLTVFGEPKYKYSGKSSSGKLKDDAAFSLQAVCFYALMLRNRDSFVTLCEKLNVDRY